MIWHSVDLHQNQSYIESFTWSFVERNEEWERERRCVYFVHGHILWYEIKLASQTVKAYLLINQAEVLTSMWEWIFWHIKKLLKLKCMESKGGLHGTWGQSSLVSADMRQVRPKPFPHRGCGISVQNKPPSLNHHCSPLVIHSDWSVVYWQGVFWSRTKTRQNVSATGLKVLHVWFWHLILAIIQADVNACLEQLCFSKDKVFCSCVIGKEKTNTPLFTFSFSELTWSFTRK